MDKRDRRSRRVRWEALEEDLNYAPNALDRAVVSEGQIRLVIRTFRERLFTEIFPGRSEVPKTLIFAKDDSHADDIVRIVREEFGRGNDFCHKITSKSSVARIVDPQTGKVTFKSTNVKAEDLLSSFRNSVNPRIAVTVDMIATGTDIKPLEIVFFLRDVKSANYFEQMKGRGSRTIAAEEFQSVTPGGVAKTRFVLVDAVGTTERERTDAPSLDRQPSVAFGKLLEHIGMGSTNDEVLSTLASRLSRLARTLTDAQKEEITQAAGGKPLTALIGALVDATDADKLEAQAQTVYGTDAPTDAQIQELGEQQCALAATPFLDPALRHLLLGLHQDSEQTIDNVSKDTLLFAGASEDAKAKAKALTASFAEYLKANRDEITALQFLYARPHGSPPTLKQIRELAAQFARPPHHWTPDALWRAYETLEKSRVRGGGQRVLTDLISLVRFALEQDSNQAAVLAPFAETVQERFANWMAAQEAAGRRFTPEQRQWLEMMRDHVATSLTVDADDFDSVPFNQQGGLGRAFALFGNKLNPLLQELNEALTV